MSIVWTPPPNNSAGPPNFGPPGSDITSSLVALLLISPPTCSYPVPYRVHRACWPFSPSQSAHTLTQKRVEADENFKEKQERTGQAQPDGHVTKLRSLGTLISQLLPGHAEPVKGWPNQTF
ncbi:hypothetical protein CROQUDRAFT_97145 [Cronartium quercuum f. sp. fusiforme G11]|uniref:Uncharacterized protein n=1 Tax=Cronartium quercuum f. sp. fusiforme G11 TaxID=708437 RepID=A0A9P6T9Q1_9BASI|nr:hypothetical protein CROQUDRAFT_97145 [Cronartium quercuum f. sp. fusiforme G11]